MREDGFETLRTLRNQNKMVKFDAQDAGPLTRPFRPNLSVGLCNNTTYVFASALGGTDPTRSYRTVQSGRCLNMRAASHCIKEYLDHTDIAVYATVSNQH